ncbi:MAG: PAS domain S-box protein, partial [Xanthobacteraceae bacterium]
MKPRILTSSVSEARFSSVLNIATDGIIVLDERAQILVFNRACESLFGYASAEVLGAPAEMILPPGKPDDSDGYLWNPGHGRASNVACMSHEAKALHKDGTIFPVELSMGQTMTPEGRQFIGILRDLRSRSAAEQRVNQLQTDVLRTARGSAIDEMGALLAHELNQPLTALLLYLHTVERLSLQPSVNAALPQSAIAILEKAVHEAERAGHIIQRMRRFVEKRDPLRRLTDVTLLIDDAVELALLGARPECRIVCELAPNLPPVAIDPVQIQQIVVNLARNALDAVKDQLTPEVRISTQQT